MPAKKAAAAEKRATQTPEEALAEASARARVWATPTKQEQAKAAAAEPGE